MPANVQTMAYYGDGSWYKLGTRVPKDDKRTEYGEEILATQSRHS